MKETGIRLNRGRLCQNKDEDNGRKGERQSKKEEAKSARRVEALARRSQRAKSRRAGESVERI